MRGYKAFDQNLRCRGFQYEIGQTYEIDEEIVCCMRGFHFCKDLADCYRYYLKSKDTKICEVEAVGEIKTDDNIKYCTNKIKILSEVKNPREKSNVNTSSSGYCNSGSWNSGDNNSGSWNSGDRNSGDRNSGRRNSGDSNKGNYNSGDYNSGGWNSGIRNTGNYNSGHCNIGVHNSGNRNSGDYNSGSYNTGNRNCGDWNRGEIII